MSSPADDREESSSTHNVIESLLEVKRVADGAIDTALDETNKILYIGSYLGRSCCLVSYRLVDEGIRKAVPRKTLIEFSRHVSAVCLDSDVGALIVATRDGRLWHSAMSLQDMVESESPQRAQPQHASVMKEMILGRRLLGTNVIHLCRNFSDEMRMFVTAGSTLLPPQLVMVRGPRDDPQAESVDIQGLKYVDVPITSVLFVKRENISRRAWSLLSESAETSRRDGAVLFGFSDGSIRTCRVGVSGQVNPVKMVGFMGQSPHSIISILQVSTGDGKNLIVAVNSLGEVAVLNDSPTFRMVLPGLKSGRRWVSAAPITCGLTVNQGLPGSVMASYCRHGVLAVCSFGFLHVYLIPKVSDAVDIGSGPLTLAVRNDVASIASCFCFADGKTWVAVRTKDGSVLALPLDFASLGISLLSECSEYRVAGPLEVARLRRHSSGTKEDICARNWFRGLNFLAQEMKNASAARTDSDQAQLRRAQDVGRAAVATSCGTLKSVATVTSEGDWHSVMATAGPVQGTHWTPSLHVSLSSKQEEKTITEASLAANCSIRYAGTVLITCTTRDVQRGDELHINTALPNHDQSIESVYVALSSTDGSESVGGSDKRHGTQSARSPSFLSTHKDAADDVLVLPIPACVRSGGSEIQDSKESLPS